MKHTTMIVPRESAYYMGKAETFVVRHGRLFRERWYHLPRRALSVLVWWRQRRVKVVRVDAERGVITMAAMRWSWRRWRWEVAGE